MPDYKANQFYVRGCGVDRLYTCKDEGMVRYGHASCTYTAGAAAAKPAANPGPESVNLGDEPADLEALPPEPPAAVDE
jgi:hypothetical protein